MKLNDIEERINGKLKIAFDKESENEVKEQDLREKCVYRSYTKW